ncbi:MAG: acyltransferase [Formosimonas sp.]
MNDKRKHWAGIEEAGFSAGMWLMYQLYRLLGRLPFRLVLYPVMGYFFMVRREARQASLAYLRRVSGSTMGVVQSNYRTSFRHFLSFGETLLDKILSQTGRYTIQNVTVMGRDELKKWVNSGRGAVLFTAHLGNLELCRALAELSGVPITVLVHTQHAEKFNSILQKVNPNNNVTLMQVADFGAAQAMALSAKVAAGGVVIIAADRTSLNGTAQASVDVPFLGADAPFPIGPYVLAHVLQCPVYLIFCFRKGSRYHLVFETFADAIRLSRNNRQTDLTSYAQRFAQRLAQYCQQSPLQWFNFYAFWKSPS